MWTMVSEIYYNRGRYHLTDETFITFCGNRNMLVRDYVEVRNGYVVQIGESGQEHSKIPLYNTCKRCINSHKFKEQCNVHTVINQ